MGVETILEIRPDMIRFSHDSKLLRQAFVCSLRLSIISMYLLVDSQGGY